jgi:hypothetical protein
MTEKELEKKKKTLFVHLKTFFKKKNRHILNIVENKKINYTICLKNREINLLNLISPY